MKNSVTVIRAVVAEFVQRIYLPILIVAIIISVFLAVGSILLTMVSVWWWILAVPVFILVLVAATVLIVARLVIMSLTPKQSTTQKFAVKAFVDKLQNLSEITQTPKIVLLFRIVKDAVIVTDDGFLKTTIGHSLSLKKDFVHLQQLFQPHK